MRAIGGELELKINDHSSYFTDSGRSSLRLFLRSFDNKSKKYLIPNFLCEIVESVFIQEGIDYDFYNVFEDLSIEIESIKEKEFDVLYIINYFGKYTDISSIELEDRILIEDNVFFYNFENYNKAKNWYAFNSFRKVSPLPDGSLIKTTIEIEEQLIQNKESEFYKTKLEAKNIKYEHVNNDRFFESDYLEKFTKAETILDKQTEIYKMSNISLENSLSFNIEKEQKIRKSRFEKLYLLFGEYCINEDPDFYSFFVMKIENRDAFRKNLMDENIFLPIHWPQSTQSNILYQEIISIPLFEIYADIEFDYLTNKIKAIL